MIKKEHLILLIIFLLSIYIRTIIDPGMPYHYDPGKNMVYARAALEWLPLVPQYNPFFNLGEYYEYQALFPYIVAVLYKITGISLVLITKPIISGAALSLTIYYLSLEVFGNKISAIVSAYLIAVSRIQLIGYMNYYPQIMAMSIMPVSFIFLIRYLKYKKLKYIILASIFSSLIVLASYIAAFVFFIIVIISLTIYGILNKNFKALIVIPITASLLTFFWLPMVWRHGIMKFTETFAFRILNTPAAFTNQPWSLMNYITFSESTVIAIIAGIIAIFIRKLRWDYSRLLIAVWLISTFALMESITSKQYYGQIDTSSSLILPFYYLQEGFSLS